jgi:DNA-binding MarR family transcriptional regulator
MAKSSHIRTNYKKGNCPPHRFSGSSLSGSDLFGPDLLGSGFQAWLQLVRAYNYMEAIVSADLRPDKLTLARFHVLAALAKFGPMNQQALADQLKVTKGNVVGLIDKLSARGLLERKPSGKDGRVNLLKLTRAGQRTVDRILPRQMKLIEELMQPLNEREADQLEAMLTRLRPTDRGAQTRQSA